MFKTSDFFNEFCGQPSNAMTPIRDYDNDYFHKNDNKLPKVHLHKHGQGSSFNDLSTRSKQLTKRPASLSLDDINEPFLKKHYSPINADRFSSSVKIKDAPPEPEMSVVPEITAVFSILRLLYESENEYAELIEIANLVYRNELRETKSYRSRLLESDSNEEFLLFGNLETISSISRLFVSGLKEIIMSSNSSREIDQSTWEEINSNSSLQKKIISQLNVGEVFQTNFFRIKSTYLSYCGSHRKQMELFENMKSKNPHLFYRWYEYCYKTAGNKKLEDILKRPVERISEWLAFLEKFLSLSPKTLNVGFSQSIEKAYEKYNSFSNYIENETSEFNGNAMYDFSLTPMEIIQSYEPDKQTKPHLELSSIETLNHGRESSQTLPVQRREEKQDYLRVSNGVESMISGSSSRYSGDTMAAQSIEPPQRQKVLSVVSKTCRKTQYTLADHVSKFKKIHQGLVQFKNAISNDEMLSILDINLRQAELWQQVEDIIIANSSEYTATEKARFSPPICSAYTEKLKRQREEAVMMKLTFFESSVKKPLMQLLSFCDVVRTQLKDLNSLKKDYMVYLRQKSSHTVDVKREIIGKHFEQMHTKMAQDLPQFIELVHRTLKFLILNYHKVVLKYLEISAGGENSIIRDLEQLGKLKRDVGRNYDILQMYSKARYCAKRLVRENWQFEQDPTSSRVLRRLFEL